MEAQIPKSYNIAYSTYTKVVYHISGILSGDYGEAFMRYFKEYLYRIFDGQLSEHSEIPKEYRLHHAVSSYAETVRWWLKGHSAYTTEEISAFYFESVNI